MSLRVEYLDFETVALGREFRFRVFGSEGSNEFRFRIATSAFDAGGVSMQDGPDVCYQKLLRAVAAGEAASPDVITVDEADLTSYRETHTRAPKYKSWNPSPPPEAFGPPRPPRTPSRPLAAAPVAAEPRLDEGQRVSHAAFGVGVTGAVSGGHVVVRFDRDGPKTFVTSMLQVDVLSAPHTWETTARGNNRPCRVPVAH